MAIYGQQQAWIAYSQFGGEKGVFLKVGYLPTLMMREKIAIPVKRGIQKVLHINKALDRMYVEPQQLYCCDVGFTISKRFYKRKFFLMH